MPWPRSWFDLCGFLLACAVSPVLLWALFTGGLVPLFSWVAALVAYLWWSHRREVHRG